MGATRRRWATRDSDYFVKIVLRSYIGRRAVNTDKVRGALSEVRLARLADVRDVLGKAQLEEAVERGVHDRDVVRGTHRLRKNVFHTGGFKDRAHTTTGDKTGAGRGGLEHHAAAIVLTENVVWDRVTLELHGDEMFVGVCGALLDGVRNFVGLAVADSDAALAVADNGERREGEAASAFHDLG